MNDEQHKHLPDDYYQKKYSLSATHSEVIELMSHVESGDVLDLGSGRGRNSIYLHNRGFKVTAVDKSESSIQTLREIIAAEEQCQGIEARIYDIESASIDSSYDVIISTVVLQFLSADCIPAVIENMQAQTRPGGFNLIVAPLSTDACPCPIDLPFTFKADELRSYYKGWQILKYEEAMGAFHRKDEQGRPYRAKFAALIAQKPG